MIGKTLGNRYEIIERIGGGGMAVVYKAKCRLLNRYVAVKVLREEFTNNEDFINRFNRESQSAASLTHENIVGIYDVGCEDNTYYIVMEYVKGKTLKQLIREKGKLKPKKVIEISMQIAKALNNAHKNNIVHRDIKPHNILINEEGKIKVTDFGIARAATSSTVTVTSNVIGSVHYFSPEQARGGYTDAKSDIYSLGIVMYEMLTGEVPFQGDSPISVALKHIREDIAPLGNVDDTIPKALEKIVTKAVQKDQALRYDSAEDIINDLEKASNNMQDDTIEFKNFDDSPTMVIPKEDVLIESDKLLKEDNETKDIKMPIKRRRPSKGKATKTKDNEKVASKGSRVLTAIAAVVLAFIVVGALAFGYIHFKDAFIKDEVTLPNLVGLDVKVAEKQMQDLGLKLVVKKEEFNDEYGEGKIISQSEEVGSKLKTDYPVEVNVSKGTKLIEVPDLISKSANEAEIALSDVTLKEGEVTHEFSEYPRGIVISQSPKAFEQVKEGTKVSYTVSNGPKVEYLIMPKYTGKDVEAAKKLLVSNGFVVGEIKYEKNNDVPKGVVISQSHPAGQEVESGIKISLVVSNGSQNTDGDSEDNNEEDTSTVETNVPAGSKSTPIKLQLPEGKDKVAIKIYRIQNDKKEVVYDKTVTNNNGGIKILVTGEGKCKFEIYFDGVNIGSLEHTF
ncbi:Stk1 family PASTA domain-containing Ser/Thr kinase [Clostridiaceae bacterium M8S5]|nr:Stk1 family PASTA domain-containing Ser/Thr kinase [Clostridiaceae bacterium M8S5]